ncbi:MAG: 50S ribosomal protein L1 [Bacteroidetes bacterium]|nr:50S ribosomal protein L1 [Bacteroidota bacterium]MBP7399140.1 50S ribosomal protein L1 [Chitinophagales bacterium]MBK8488560.1 50S ribosomal protein L1 [Bacteroidota bacterium]MBK8681680.1 50S ribosomal protein L1 [Bacteroidota bacterium]MBP8754734.1 50S ribosomal protein L1 [Chitinophagales bacterium]
MKITKNRKKTDGKLEPGKMYTIQEASALVKQVTTCKFNASVDLHIRLGIDPRKADQAIRGTTALPHGTGKEKKVLVLCTPEFEEDARKAGADFIGLDDYVEKIMGGWTDIDVVIATPSVMPKIAKLGRVLGPRNLMPNPKVGTVTNDVGNAVTEVKRGKVAFKVDKYGIIHSSIGRISFEPNQIAENSEELIRTLSRMKPSSAKGIYFKSITMASTMSPGIAIDPRTIPGA